MRAFLEAVPPEHREAFAPLATAAVPDWINTALHRLRAAGVPWQQLAALVPLILAAIANPATGIGPLVLAVIELLIQTFNPPVPAPA